MKKKMLITGLIMVFLLPALASAGKVYQWTDDDGVITYGESPPKGVDAREVKTYRSPSGQEEAVKALQERVQAAQQRDAEANEADDKGDQQLVSDEFCEGHRKNLKLLRESPQVMLTDPETGEDAPMSSEKRAALIKETEEALKLCP